MGHAELTADDLRERLTTAHAQLTGLADDRFASGAVTEGTRLRGKAEGVALALSYMDEYARAQA